MTEALGLYKEARAPRDYKREYAQYHAKPQKVAERSQRNQARRIVGLEKGDPREVDHKNPISNGGSNAKSNLQAISLVENRKKFTKTAAQLYHGSPFGGLTSLSPREPRGHTDYERQRAVFMTDNPDAAALYALARDKERKNRGWAAIGGRLQLGPSAGLNEKGYLYSVNTDDYLSPPKGQENSGFAIPREVGVSGVKEVTPAEYEHLIDRFDTKGAFKDHIRSLISKERPKDQEKIKMLQAHLKTASTKHHLITGVPGAGKSTIARRIAKEKGLPLFEIDSDPRFKRALQLIDEGKVDESNALQKQMFHDAIARKDPHVIEGAQVMLDPALARQHELQILDGSVDELAPRWANREAIKHRERAVSAGKLPTKDETYYDSLYRNIVYPRYQEQLAGLRKTASSRHYLVTGHSGAGKSTLARKLSEETGAPIVSLDDVPSIRALLEEQKATAKVSGGKLDLSPETTAKKKAVELKAIQDAIAAKNPAIIEGSYLLDHDPSMFKGHKMMLVDRARDSILDQRVERQRLSDLSNGKEWSDARAAGVRARGSQLLDYYQPGVDTWRNSSLVEKRADAVATKTDPAKWEAAKQEAKSKMGGKHSARAMQLATKIYKDNGGGYSGAKPTSSTNSLKKWTKQDWGYSGKDKPGPGGTGVYLPKQRRVALKSSEDGKRLLANAAQKKREATRSGEQYSSHGLAAGTSLTKKASKLTAAARNQISEGNFALPGRRYPIHDITHARSALSMVAAHGTPAEKTTVRKAVHAKFPSIGENK